jgi:hypothetical protein
MAYSIWWPLVVRHHGYYWTTPGDLWDTVRVAHYIGWGGLSYVYAPSSHAVFVTLPGFATLLAPVVALATRLGLTESAPTVHLFKPQAWLVVGPFCLLASGTGLFGLDALNRRLGAQGPRSAHTLFIAAAALWPATAIWGHPEDSVAIGLVAFAFVAMMDDRWGLTGWLLGAAIAMQLLAVLVVPIFIGVAGARKAAPLLARAAILPGFFTIAVVVPDLHDALNVLLKQPTFPSLDHATPWVALSPVIAPHVVAAGPSRLLAAVVAVGAGWYASRHRSDLGQLVTAACVVLASRCVFESVMVPYYVMPFIAFALIAAFRLGWARAVTVSAAALGLTVMTHYHLYRWLYYGEMMGLMALVLAPVLLPRRRSSREGPLHEAPALVLGAGAMQDFAIGDEDLAPPNEAAHSALPAISR